MLYSIVVTRLDTGTFVDCIELPLDYDKRTPGDRRARRWLKVLCREFSSEHQLALYRGPCSLIHPQHEAMHIKTAVGSGRVAIGVGKGTVAPDP